MSVKMRVFQVAREFNISNEALIAYLTKLNFDIRNQMSLVSDDAYALVAEKFGEKAVQVDEEYEFRRRLREKKANEEAKKLGVEFEFNHTVDNPKELPKGSIIATGFYPDMFDIFKTPCRKARGFFALKKNTDPELDGLAQRYGGVRPGSGLDVCFAHEGLSVTL